MKPTARVHKPPRPKSADKRLYPPSLGSLVRTLRRDLPVLSDKYKVRSLGVFGSYVRGDQRADSDLDLLVEFEGGEMGAPREALAKFLTERLHTQADVIPVETLAARPYFGRNVLRHALWLLKNGIPQTIPLKRNGTGDAKGEDMDPKREYLDFIQDMLTSMVKAQSFAGDLNIGQIQNDPMRWSAIKYEIQTIGEAAGKIPADVRALYPEIPWGEMIGMRNRLVHGYAQIDSNALWEILHDDPPNDQMLVTEMFKREKKRRKIDSK